jgi:hypothetical protein
VISYQGIGDDLDGFHSRDQAWSWMRHEASTAIAPVATVVPTALSQQEPKHRRLVRQAAATVIAAAAARR